MNKPNCCEKCRDHVKDGIRIKGLCNNAACECHVAKTATGWEESFQVSLKNRMRANNDALLRGEVPWIMAFIRETLSLERAAIVEQVEELRKVRIPETASESACGLCGFPNDHRICFCMNNFAIDAVLKILTSPDPEKTTPEILMDHEQERFDATSRKLKELHEEVEKGDNE